MSFEKRGEGGLRKGRPRENSGREEEQKEKKNVILSIIYRVSFGEVGERRVKNRTR